MHKWLRIAISFFWGEGFSNEQFSSLTCLKYIFIQKVLGVNRKVKWPVHWSSQIISPEKIVRGTRAPGMSIGCFIDGRNGIILGENVWIGPRVSLISMNHDSCTYENYIKEKPIKIGANCLVCANSVILPNVEIGDHTIVAAGAVVTKSFTGSNQVVAGNPARIVKDLPEYNLYSTTAGTI